MFGVIVLMAAATFKYARIGRLSGPTVHYFTAFSNARNVMGGTEVWINGTKVGRVSKVHFAAPSVDTARRVVVEIEVLRKHREQIRENSVVRLGTGARIMGPTVVYISAGTPDARVVGANDTIPTTGSGDVQAVTARFGEVTKELTALMANVKVLTTAMTSTEGAIAALTGSDAPERLETLVENASRLAERATAAKGSLGMAMDGGALMARARIAAAQADSLRALVTSDRGSLGRFRRDSTLLQSVAAVRDELSITSRLLASRSGTLGRFAEDSIIAVQMTEMSKQMADLLKDMKRRPFRYIAF